MLKKHKACCKKYKPYILKYKALISKYMPYIFRCYKRLVYKVLRTPYFVRIFSDEVWDFFCNKYNNGHIIIHKSPIVLKNNRAFYLLLQLKSICM